MIIVLAALLIAAILQAQAPAPTVSDDLETIFNFEGEQKGQMPRGWGGGPPDTIAVDGQVVHGGRWSVRLQRDATSAETFTTITKRLPLEFAGHTIEWRGFLRTKDVSDFVGLWLREDGDAGMVAFDNMQQRQVKGTSDWTEYSVTLPLHSEAKQLYFGVLIAGTGTAWADDLQLLVDGKPVWDAPKAERPKTAVDLDHEFDSGSGIAVERLSAIQVANLALLCKVWGFAKYHHPLVAAGARHWDYDLFRVMPKVLAAPDRGTATAAIVAWIRGLGDVQPCSRCATPPPEDVQLKPEIAWIRQPELGAELWTLLEDIHRNRPTGPQFYVSAAPNIGNPVFDHELAYPGLKLPDAGYQLLALYRFWNIVEYWSPNRGILDERWDAVLTESIPTIALAKSADEYQLALLAMIAKDTDTHANLWSAPPQSRPPAGPCQLPIVTRFVGGRPVVTGFSESTAGPATGFKVGDVIESLNGRPVQTLVKDWMPYYPASNDATRLHDIARGLTRGPCTTVAVGVARSANATSVIRAERLPIAKLHLEVGITHDLPGETFRLFSKDVAYLKLSSVKAAEVAGFIARAKDTKGLVVDIRNYPSEFVVFTLGSLLVERPTPFALFTSADLQNPGAFRWGEPVALTPAAPHYSGKIVILVDEVSQSQAEYTAMALRAAPQAVVIGSMTAGADGDVSPIPLPGGHRAMISGLGVFYPDKKPTQRIGIVPNVEVRPTIGGIRAGRDEVLEAALRQILGPATPQEDIEGLYRR